MSAGQLVREGRRRRGYTQRQVANAVGLSQPTIARIEAGEIEPTFAQVQRLLGATGLELRVSLTEIDDADWSVAQSNLRLSPDARVRQHQAALRFASAGRAAMARARPNR